MWEYFVSYLKITKDRSLDGNLNAKIAFQLKYKPRVRMEMQTSDAGLSNSASHAGLSNLASYFKCGLSNAMSHAHLSNSTSYFKHRSEQLRVSLQTRV